MELAYRLAVDESPRYKEIRDNVIVLMTPVVEVDGHNRQVDLWHYRQANPKLPTPPLAYWGHYVAHDNNRDNLGVTLALSRNVLKAYFDFHPTVMHDLHESVPFMYVMTGTGPYNPSLDPLMIDEFTRMAYHEVDEMTRRGNFILISHRPALRVGNSAAQAGVANSKTAAITASRRMTGISLADAMPIITRRSNDESVAPTQRRDCRRQMTAVQIERITEHLLDGVEAVDQREILDHLAVFESA